MKMYAYFAVLSYFANKVEERTLTNMESDMENEPYLKLMQYMKDKPPTSGTYAIVENNAPKNLMKAMKAKTPWNSLHTSAKRSWTPALNLETTPEQHARIMKNTYLARAATVHHVEGSWKKTAKQPLQGDQEATADSNAQRAAGMERVQSHLREE